MAHSNIYERQAKVNKFLEEGKLTHSEIRKQLSIEFKCSPSAIHADIIQFRTRGLEETIYQSKSIRKLIYDRDKGTCQYCGNNDADNYIVEHVIPAYYRGVAKEYNLVLACQKCNTTKRREVWTPFNLEEITIENPEWREKILTLSIKDFRK